MSIAVAEKKGDVEVYGAGAPGGKGTGLIRINEISIAKVGKLRTRILATDFYDRYLERDGHLREEDRDAVVLILEELGDVPLGVRSSAGRDSCSPK